MMVKLRSNTNNELNFQECIISYLKLNVEKKENEVIINTKHSDK